MELDATTTILVKTGALIYAGALVGHILSLYSSDLKGSVPFWKNIFPGKTESFYFRLDFLVLPIIGLVLAYVLIRPADQTACLTAGLTWSGTLLGLLKRAPQPSGKP